MSPYVRLSLNDDSRRQWRSMRARLCCDPMQQNKWPSRGPLVSNELLVALKSSERVNDIWMINGSQQLGLWIGKRAFEWVAPILLH